MNYLSFNTTSAGTQFCLQKGEEMFFLETEFSKHSETFFPLLDEFLNKQNISLDDVDVFGCVVGPGSFTGIRIGLSVIKMFAYAKQKKCVAVNALMILAYNNFTRVTNNQVICSVINAGAENLFYQLFQKTEKGLKEITQPKLCTFLQFEKIKSKMDNVLYCYYDDGKQGQKHTWLENYTQQQTAKSLGECVKNCVENKQFVDFHKIVPLYLRNSQAEKIEIGNFEIVLASKDDIPEILDLEAGADDGLPWTETALCQSFENQSFKCYLLKQSNEILGYVSIMDLGDEYEILRIVVSPNARNQGVAKNLLTFLFDKAKQDEVLSVVLEVNEFNFSAQLLYEGLGFDVVGKRTNYYHDGQDGFVMRKYIQVE